VISIGQSAFEGCNNIVSLKILNGVEAIGSYAFLDCIRLGGQLVIPSSVETIGEQAFRYTGITSVDFLQTTGLIVGNHAFRDTSLNTIKFGSSIPEFGANSFREIPSGGVVFYPWNIQLPTAYEAFIVTYLDGQNSPGWIVCKTLEVDANLIPASIVGEAISEVNVVSGVHGGTGLLKSYALAGGSLPLGLELSGTTGIISGTPTNATPAGSITVVVSDSGVDLLAQSTEIVVPYGAVTVPGSTQPVNQPVNHSIRFHSHDKNFGGKDGLTAYGEDVIVQFEGDFDTVQSFLFNGEEYELSDFVIKDTKGTAVGKITEGSVIVTLYAEFADRLENRTHELQVWFEDSTEIAEAGVATIVVNRSTSGDNPNPGDDDNPNPGDNNNDNPNTGDNNNDNPNTSDNSNETSPNTGDSSNDRPKTSDDMNLALLITLCGGSLLALILLIICRRKAKLQV
jgi:hypothetical protein